MGLRSRLGPAGEEGGGGRLAAGLFVLWEGWRVGQSPETGGAWPPGWRVGGGAAAGRDSDGLEFRSWIGAGISSSKTSVSKS